MNISPRKTAVAIAAALALSTLALTGCSGGGGGENTPPPQPAATTPPKTFTSSDLIKILTAANTSLNAGGTVANVGNLSANSGGSATSVYQYILSQGGSITPATCGQLFDKINTDVSTLGNDSSAYAAELQYGDTNILSATTSPTLSDVTNIGSTVKGDLDSLTTQCASATVIDGTLSATLAFATATASTNADQTYAYTEDVTVGTTVLHSVAVIAVDGSLLIGFEGFGAASSVSDGEAGINAVVAAAQSE